MAGLGYGGGLESAMPGTFLSSVQGFTPVIDVLADELGLVTAAVYGVVWRYCQGRGGVCQASVGTIAGHLGISSRSTIRHLKRLVEYGYLEDLTPDLRYRPHTYADTGRAEILGLVEARVEAREARQVQKSEECQIVIPKTEVCQFVTPTCDKLSHLAPLGMTDCHMYSDNLSHKDTREKEEREIRENMGSATCLDAISLWQASKCILKEQIPENVFDTWLSNSDGITLDDHVLVVGVYSPYAKDWLENRLYSQIQRAASDVRGSSTSVRFVVSTNAKKSTTPR